MKKRLKAILVYFLFWIAFFAVARLLFILTKCQEASEFTPAQLFSTFRYGIKLDLSATGYIMIIPVLLMIPGIYFEGKWFRKFMRCYTIIITGLSSIIVVSDTLLYKYWGFRMDHTPLLYLRTPEAAMASVSTLQIIVVVIGIILLAISFIYLYYRFADRHFEEFEKIRFRFPALLFFVVFWGSLLIPIRGGVGIAPINAGTVYFSRDLFLNHTAINVVWNVGNSLSRNKPAGNPYQFYDTAVARQMTDTLTADRGSPARLVSDSRPNILILVLESFGSAMIGPLGGDSLTTPNFNRYVKEGILFTRFYASGNRTDKAFPAILCGYPSQPSNSIMKEPKKTQSLPGLVKMMNSQGYHTSFWYGGEINFANFNSFVINTGFRTVVTRDNFKSEFYNSKWGVHDHILLETLHDSMKSIKEPFMKVVLTLSSHEPFDVPMKPVFRGNDE
ncbi:MAG: sulfatase-like hydrolase/transferase, partial [Bacteroidales bacterium]|nr:sulfatase-like hydrolase/transferase [Bacteroidales bacterium]